MSSAEEHFDIVDADDRVVGVAPRRVAHRDRLRHRAVAIFVLRPSGELLIQRRALGKDEYPGRWSPSACGHVSAGDSYDRTAPRELHEEVGLHGDLVRHRKFGGGPDTDNEFLVLYSTVAPDPRLVPDPGEVAELRWIGPGELDRWMDREPDAFTPSFRLMFRWWLASGAQGTSGESGRN